MDICNFAVKDNGASPFTQQRLQRQVLMSSMADDLIMVAADTQNQTSISKDRVSRPLANSSWSHHRKIALGCHLPLRMQQTSGMEAVIVA